MNVDILYADRMRCPVCGEPHGDCAGETQYQGQINFVPNKVDDPYANFVVPRRIYEERKDKVTGKVYKRLLYPKGARITPEEAKRLHLLPR